MSSWNEEIEALRKSKDRFFAEHWQSPIPPEKRISFKGLKYFPPDPNYRFEIPLHEHEKKESLQITDTGGNVREYIRWGEFRFKIDDKELKLQAYKDEPGEKRLFVPFRDKTNGKETYGAGRYIDLDEDRDKTVEGKWILDFNKAYNPWCAYSENYVCPFVPPENWLPVPIYAGEKNFEE